MSTSRANWLKRSGSPLEATESNANSYVAVEQGLFCAVGELDVVGDKRRQRHGQRRRGLLHVPVIGVLQRRAHLPADMRPSGLQPARLRPPLLHRNRRSGFGQTGPHQRVASRQAAEVSRHPYFTAQLE